MSKNPKSNSSAILHLSKDPVMKTLISTYGELFFDWESDLYEDLIDSIISQQLSVKAAATISKRFKALYGETFPTPKEILAMPDDNIRECGISYSKIKYIKGIAEAIEKKEIDLEKLPKLRDEEVIAELTKLKGIGRWTAEMTLMFTLKRLDVFSMGDLGLRNAVSRLYHVDRDDLEKIEKISKKWSPYRTIAARYLWKSLDNLPK